MEKLPPRPTAQRPMSRWAAYERRWCEQLPKLIDTAVDEHDFVVVEHAVDLVEAGERVSGLHRSDRLMVAVELMRRGGRTAALRRLGFAPWAIRALLAWSDARREVAA